ncbi:MAG TPA: tol-pal system protein YbgF [Gemmatimonadaceae bacterium]|nr:tol-pal system protein YbgF [Gemmatimonadaceae bacterium]
MPPAVLFAAGACFATREDVRLLQTQLQTYQTQNAQADSTRRAQLDRVIQQLGLVTDSLGDLGARLAKFQGDIEGSVYSMGQQLIQVQELTGQSQRRLQELRAGLEVQRGTFSQPPQPGQSQGPGATSPGGATPGVDSGRAAATGTPPAATAPTAPSGGAGTPGPNELYQLALDQLRRGSTGSARTALSDLLKQYPNADVAPDAQFYVADSYDREGNTAAADSVYQLVVQRYPSSERAPTALYKHGLTLITAGKVQAARAALQQVVSKYPRSDEAVLAKDRLRTLK